jgi:hypothetical protein
MKYNFLKQLTVFLPKKIFDLYFVMKLNLTSQNTFTRHTYFNSNKNLLYVVIIRLKHLEIIKDKLF